MLHCDVACLSMKMSFFVSLADRLCHEGSAVAAWVAWVMSVCDCSTGWLSHWGEVMANTSAQFVLQTLSDILSYKNGTGSVNFYMAHGGSNFGYWAGELLFGKSAL